MDNISNKSFCPMPFKQVVIRSKKTISPCCFIPGEDNIQDNTINDYFNGDKISSIRKKMIAGEEVIECKQCILLESQSNTSPRKSYLRDYNFTSQNDIDSFKFNEDFPERIEFHVSNLCNLKCLTCNPRDSSMFLTENRKLKISTETSATFQIPDNIIKNILDEIFNKKIKILDLRGGETLLVPVIKEILQNVPDNICNQIELRIQTNCTIFDTVWEDIFKKFKGVEIMLSIDAVKEANHYIRYPSKWELIEKNIDKFRKLPNLKNIFINCTVSNLNFTILDNLIKWAIDKNIYCHFFPLYNPEIYRHTNLPEILFTQGVKIANEYKDCFPSLESLLHKKADTNNWNNFCKMINIRDNHRSNSIFEIHPEFKKYWI